MRRASEKRKEKSGRLEKRMVPPLHRVGEGLSDGARDSSRSQREPGYPRDLMPVSPDLPGSVGILTARGKPMIPVLFHTLSSEPPPPLSTPHPEASLTPSGFSNSRLVEESSQHLVLFACSPHTQAGLPPPNHFASKDASSQSYGFSSNHVRM